MKTFIYSINFNVPLKNKEEVEKLLQECPALAYDVEEVEDEDERVALFIVFNSQKSEEKQSAENFTNLLEKLKNFITMKIFIYSLSFNVPLKNKEEVEKFLKKCPPFTYDVEEVEDERVALFDVFDTFVDKNSQKSEEEQSVENFTNLLEKLKNL